MSDDDADQSPASGGGRSGRAGRLLDALPQGQFFRGAVTIAGATGAAQLISIGASPIVSRLYSPADYGAFAVAGAILTLLIAVSCLRYELAIPLPRDDTAAADVMGLSLFVTVLVSVALVPIVLLIGPTLMDAIGASSLRGFVLLLPIGVLAGGALAAFTAWMIRLTSYRQIAANRLAQSGGTVGVQIGLGLLNAGAPGLLVGTVVGSLAGLSRLVRAARSRSRVAFAGITSAGIAGAARRYRRFPLYSAPSVALNLVGLDAPLVWMVIAYGAEVGGEFALAQRVVALPIAVLAAAVGQVYFAEAARLVQDSPRSLRGLFTRTTRSLALTAVIPFVVGALLAPFLFPVIFGPEWATAGLYVAILAPMSFMQFVAWPTGGTLDVLERQDLHLVREVGRLVLVGVVIVLATTLQLTATGAVIALSAAGVVTNLLYGTISWAAIVRSRRLASPRSPADAERPPAVDVEAEVGPRGDTEPPV